MCCIGGRNVWISLPSLRIIELEQMDSNTRMISIEPWEDDTLVTCRLGLNDIIQMKRPQCIDP